MEEHGVVRWRAKDLVKWTRFGVKYSVRGVQLRRMGFRFMKPRPFHPRSDRKKIFCDTFQEQVKKEVAGKGQPEIWVWLQDESRIGQLDAHLGAAWHPDRARSPLWLCVSIRCCAP